jgi:DNA-binding XRE family transcriptional regulator
MSSAACQAATVKTPIMNPQKQKQKQKQEQVTIPHEVVSVMLDGATPTCAWREHLNLTQEDVAARLGMSLSAYVMHEKSDTPQRLFLEQVAAVLGLVIEQLDL